MDRMTLPDGRSYLPKGTILKFEYQGGFYKILGEPVGYGGAGIIYPAVRVVKDDGQWKEEEMWVALKECCPLSTNGMLKRDDHGGIVCADERDGFSAGYYTYAKEMMRREKEITGRIFNKGFRLTPVWDIVEQEEIAVDGEHFYPAENQFGIMERLDEKGSSLGNILRAQKGGCLTAYQSVCILVQILQAIAEVHDSGFLHGDIQENNVFLKGTDFSQDEEGVVTLIDFGTARPLVADGATDIIGDRKLFTTNGYCAPECALAGEGTLRLTRAADLYSVGYLMLRMLNGKTMDTKALQLVVNGKYIYARQAKKIGCPSGSIDAVNRILEKALQQKPEERYQTAEEMLEDLKRLERALAPEKSAIASVDYEAFISYCHEEKSSWAADLIQKKIEHYKIPKSVQKMSGKKKMGKVFRDREELSSSSDMEVHLKEALDHSAFLVVLLSPKVPQSPWVAREMELFLQNHDREHILTILVDGELEESFPEALRKNEKFDGRQMKMQSVESLAADIRGADKTESKKKLKTEIYRLLAPMLGCSYDDLRQRQKEYRMQRMIKGVSAAAVVLGAAAGYMGWQAVQIHENYWQTLKEKSRYLAKVSGELLESGDRMTAIQVAMEALPDSEADNSKPLMAEAEAALAQSVYAYKGWFMRNEYLRGYSVMEAEVPLASINSFESESLQFLSVDKNHTVYVWDVVENVLNCKIESNLWREADVEAEVCHAEFVDADTVMIVTRSAVLYYDIASGELVRQVELEEQLNSRDTGTLQCVVTQDRKQLIVYDGVWHNDGELDVGTWRVLRMFDMEDGRLLHQAVIEEKEGGVQGMHSVSGLYVSPDSRYLAVTFYDFWEMTPQETGIVAVYDVEKEEFFQIIDENVGYYEACFTEDNCLYLYGSGVKWGHIGEQSVATQIACYDVQKQECVWEQEMNWQNAYDSLYGILEGSVEGTVFAWANRQGMVLDAKTGEVLDSFVSAQKITGVEHWLDDGYIMGTEDGTICCFESGGLGFCELGTNAKKENDQFLYDEAQRVAFLVSSKDGSVTCVAQTGDKNKTDFTVPYPITASGLYFGDSRDYLIIDGEIEETDTYYRSIYDPLTNEELYSYEMERASSFYCFNETENIYYGFSSKDSVLHAVDLDEKEVLWEEMTDVVSANVLFGEDEESGDKLAVCYNTSKLRILNLETKEWSPTLNMADKEGRENRRIIDVHFSDSGRYLLFVEYYEDAGVDRAELHVFDRISESLVELPEEFAEYEFAADYQEMVYMAVGEELAAIYEASEKQLLLLDLEKMEVVEKVPFQAVSRREATFLNNNQQMILWGDDGYMKLWDRRESTIKMVDQRQLYNVTRILVHEETGIIEVAGYEEEDLTFTTGNEWCKCWYLLDEENGFCFYTKLWFSAYSSAADRFYQTVTNNTSILCYERYSLDELLEKGRYIVGERELSEPEKIKYYIE